MNRRQLGFLVFRQWWSTRILNLVMIALLTMGVMLYLLYGAWQATVRQRLSVGSTALNMAVPVMVLGPDWISESSDSRLQLDQLLDSPLVQRLARTPTRVLVTDVLTPVGQATAFGMPLDNPLLHDALPIVSGHWPTGSNEVLLPDSVAAVGYREGDQLTFGYFDPFGPQVRWASLRLAGYYKPKGDIINGPVVSLDWLTSLSERGPNGLVLWPGEGVEVDRLRRVVLDILPTAQVRRPLISGLVPEREGNMGTGQVFKGVSSLPYAYRAQLTVLRPDLPAHVALTEILNVSVPLSKLIALILAVVTVGITLAVMGMMFDQQKNIGLFEAIGMNVDELRGLFRGMFVVDVVVSMVMGVAGSAVMMRFIEPVIQLPLHLQWGGVALWAMGYVALSLWVGRIVTVFVNEVDATEMLKGQSRPDFWAFIRI